MLRLIAFASICPVDLETWFWHLQSVLHECCSVYSAELNYQLLHSTDPLRVKCLELWDHISLHLHAFVVWQLQPASCLSLSPVCCAAFAFGRLIDENLLHPTSQPRNPTVLYYTPVSLVWPRFVTYIPVSRNPTVQLTWTENAETRKRRSKLIKIMNAWCVESTVMIFNEWSWINDHSFLMIHDTMDSNNNSNNNNNNRDLTLMPCP